jgi:hypothetical protein
VHARGLRGQAVEEGKGDWQVGPAKQQHRSASAQQARAPTRRPHWAKRERAGDLARRGADEMGPQGGMSGGRLAHTSGPAEPKGRNRGEAGLLWFSHLFPNF